MIKGAVLGSPINHSLSPRLHRAIFHFLNIEGSYEAIEVKSGELESFFGSRGNEFDYLSLTMPLKEEALKLEVSIDSLTQRIQSANTLFQSSGSWHLSSTDGSGFIQALANKGFVRFESALILGAGGTARAVAGALDEVSNSITVLGRSSTREDALNAAIQKADFNYRRWQPSIDFEDFDLVVNTTPAGAADLLADSVPGKVTPPLFDLIYKPWPTVLAASWQDRGGVVINGLELLLYQGVDQIEKLIGPISSREEVVTHLRKTLNS
jgi:shikimate dehydrogenase